MLLWEFGSATIGYDAASGEAISRRPPLGLARERWTALTAEPRCYGFHATLKAPFGLSDGASLDPVSFTSIIGAI
jgi:hypothetical protein